MCNLAGVLYLSHHDQTDLHDQPLAFFQLHKK